IEEFALVVLEHNGNVRAWSDLPELILFIGAGPKFSRAIKGEPVGAAAGLHKNRKLAIHAPFHNAVIGLVGKKHVAYAVASWPFSEGKIPGQLFQGFTGSYNFTFAGH